MKKTIILAMAALMLLSAQCKKNEQKPESQEDMVMVPIHGTMSFDQGGSKTEITTTGYVTPVEGDKIYIYNSGNYVGYLTCTPTTGQQFDCSGEIGSSYYNTTCTFMYLGTGATDADGAAITEASTSVNFTNQTTVGSADGKITGIDKFHVGSCIAKVSDEGTVALPMRTKMAIGYFQLIDEEDNPIKNSDITICNHYNTATINKENGTLSGNTLGDVAVRSDNNGCFYMAMIPKSGIVNFGFVISSKEGEKRFNKGIQACRVYTQNGLGAPIVVKIKKVAARPTSVTTSGGCSEENFNTVGGTVTLSEAQVVEYGFVYSSSVAIPEIGKDGCTTFVGNTERLSVGKKSFTIDLTGLDVETNYYIRAYAKGESFLPVYAPESNIKIIKGGNFPLPLPSDWTDGTNPHPFTVATGKTVKFSQGILQYIGSADSAYWKFADHQYDFFGSSTGQNSSSENVDRDLFGFGTSGHDHGANCYQPWSTSGDYSDYHVYGVKDYNLYDGDGTADWGCNDIYNDNNLGTFVWRMLKKSEMTHLIDGRKNHAKLWGRGEVGNCTSGLIILPDDWVLPSGLSFQPGKNTNSYSYSEWSLMEAAGAVFLPCAGNRYRTEYRSENFNGQDYPSADAHYGGSHIFLFQFSDCGFHTILAKHIGYPVRLVRD